MSGADAPKLILIRHGESEHHVAGLTGGWTDTPLTRYGREQVQRTAERIGRMCHGAEARIFSSDLRRASQTAEVVGGALGVVPQLRPELRELNNGTAAHLTEEQAKAIALPMTYPTVDWVPYPCAESWRRMEQRIWGFLDTLRAADTQGTTVLVTHANAGIVVVQWWLRLGDCCRRGISFDLDPCSVTILTTNRWGERSVAKLNDTSHLY